MDHCTEIMSARCVETATIALLTITIAEPKTSTMHSVLATVDLDSLRRNMETEWIEYVGYSPRYSAKYANALPTAQ